MADAAHILVLVLFAAAVAVIAWVIINAVIQIARSTTLSDEARAIWIVGVLIAPLLGALAWYFVRANSAPKLPGGR